MICDLKAALSRNGINRSANINSKVPGANMGSTSGRQNPGGAHVGHMNLTEMLS